MKAKDFMTSWKHMATTFVSTVVLVSSVWAIDSKYDQAGQLNITNLQIAQLSKQQNASFVTNITLIQRHIIRELNEVIIALEVKPNLTQIEKIKLLRAKKDIEAAKAIIADLK